VRYRVVVRRVAATLAFLWACSIIWAVSRVWNIRINKISAIVIGFFSIVLTSFCYFRIYWTLKLLNKRTVYRNSLETFWQRLGRIWYLVVKPFFALFTFLRWKKIKCQKKAAKCLKAHFHPNGLATVCYCFQMVILFFSRSDWLPEYSCERENCHVNSKQIGGAMSHRSTLRSCPNLRPQFTNL